MNTITHQKGFTLIELLVVISITGVLAAITVVNFSGAQAKARDTQRKTDLKAVRDALEQYKLDKGNYPYRSSTGTFTVRAQNAAISVAQGQGPFNILMSSANAEAAYSLVRTKYMPKAVSDPKVVTPFIYRYAPTDATGTGYTLETCLEGKNDPQKYATVLAPCTATYPNYRVFNI